MVNFEIIHISQYLSQLMDEGRLKVQKGYEKKVIYHDPCYLGRHNGIYDEPRNVLSKVPGLELTEFSESRDEALCCGMGGGRIWAETPKNERFVNIRTEEAVALGVKEVVTACPYCITNFEDSRAVLNYSDVIEVKDITEVLAEVI